MPLICVMLFFFLGEWLSLMPFLFEITTKNEGRSHQQASGRFFGETELKITVEQIRKLILSYQTGGFLLPEFPKKH